jgi:glycosyltransferase involved in cell wall biosynthesis
VRCLYVTNGWGIHDERWFAALEGQGFSPVAIRLGIDATSPADLVQAVESVAPADTPILAGPLNLITVHLVDLPNPIIGLSWGFDLHQMNNPAWLSRLSGIIVDSEPTAAIAREAGVNPDHITFIPWGVDLGLFSIHGAKATRESLGVPSHTRLVLSLRSHEPVYRVHDIVQAFPGIRASHANAHLVVGNTGSLTSDLKAQAAQLDLEHHVSFVGSWPERELAELMRASSLYVSASEVDGTSVTLLQAMACGLPVIASDIPGNRPWIKSGHTGQLFTLGSPESLANAASQALVEGDEWVTSARDFVVAKADWNRNQTRLRTALLRTSN